MTDTYEDAIDVPSIEQNWPVGHIMPRLVADLGALMKPWPWGVLGHWELSGEAFDEFWSQWLSDGARVDGQFGIFMGFSAGAKYAIWYHDDDAPGAHPVVYFPDDNRDISITAPNITAFLTDWASGRGIGWLEPFDHEATPELLVKRTAYGKQILDLIAAAEEPPAGQPTEELQARLTATCEQAFAIIDEKDRQRRLAEVYGDRINLTSLQKNWPNSRAYPQLISDIGTLIKPMINGSIGRCDFIGRLLPDTLFTAATDIHEQFGFFLVDHKYRWVAVWYHEGARSGSEPVVGFGEYSALESAVVLAPNLNAFLSDWARAVVDGDSEFGLSEEPELIVQRPALADAMRAVIALAPEPSNGAPIPDIREFVYAHAAAQQARDEVDPRFLDMANILKGRFPAPTEPLDLSIFATVQGEEMAYSLIAQEMDQASFPEGTSLTPLLFELRKARYEGPTRSLGPWTSAMLSLYPNGRLALTAYWEQ